MISEKIRNLIVKPTLWLKDEGVEHECVIATRVRLARNISDRHFTYKASLLDRQQIFDQVSEVCEELGSRGAGIINFMEMDRLEQQVLMERRFATRDLLNIEGHRGIVCDPSSGLSILINEEDHIRIQCIRSGFEPVNVWRDGNKVDDILGRALPFAFSEKLGFLTASPLNAGTGLRISFLMHLPGLVLTRAIDGVLCSASQMGFSTRGFFGDHGSVVGNLFQISNQICMGTSEPDSLRSVEKVIKKIIDQEHAGRDRIMNQALPEITDKVYRSYGILRYAQSLTVDEMLNLTSALRLGIESGIIGGLSVVDLSNVMVETLPGHIQVLNQKRMNEHEQNRFRVEAVKKVLSSAQL